MKWRPDKNQIRWGVTIFLTAVCCMLFYYLLFHGSRIGEGFARFLKSMMSVTYGIVIAYVLSPVLRNVEKRLFYPRYIKRGIDVYAPGFEKKRRAIRKWSILITMLLFIGVLAILLTGIIPQLIKSIRDIIVNLPIYASNITNFTNTYLADNPEIADTVNYYLDQASDWLTDFLNNTLIPQMTLIIRRLSQSMIAFVQGLFNFIIGIIVAVYILNSLELFKSGAKKLTYAFFKENTANELISGMRYAHYTFSGFIVGKLVDSIFIGILCYIGALILRTPYPVLMSVIVGVTNIIPFFGPYIGEFITFVLLLLINPMAALIFFIFVLILQQFDGNILGPKILGNSTGLSSFWVIFSVLFFGSLFGVIGWILGVPVFAVLYALVGRIADDRLKERKLPTDTEAYGDAAYAHKGQLVMKKDADWDLYHVRHPQSIWKRIFSIRREVGEKITEVVKKREGVEEPADAPAEELPAGNGNGDPVE